MSILFHLYPLFLNTVKEFHTTVKHITLLLKGNCDTSPPRLSHLIWCMLYIAGFIINIPTALLFQVIDSMQACLYTSHMRFPALHKIYAEYNIVVNVVFPTMLMLFAYIRMGLTLYRSEFSSKDKQQAQMNLFQTCVIMMLMFTLSGSNICIAILLFVVGVYQDLSGDHYTISIVLMVLNQCINPYIYSIRYREFQHQMKHLFCSKSKQLE